MKPLRLDYARPPASNVRRLSAAIGLVLLVLLALFFSILFGVMFAGVSA